MNFIPKLFHFLPDFKGKRRLMRLFLPDVINNSKDVLLPVNHDMKFKVPNFIEIISFEMLVNGERPLNQHNAPNILFEFVDCAQRLAKDVKPGDGQMLLKSYGYRIYNFVDGKLIPFTEILTSVSLMLFAFRKGISSNGY
jgi:hypothetical protein